MCSTQSTRGVFSLTSMNLEWSPSPGSPYICYCRISHQMQQSGFGKCSYKWLRQWVSLSFDTILTITYTTCLLVCLIMWSVNCIILVTNDMCCSPIKFFSQTGLSSFPFPGGFPKDCLQMSSLSRMASWQHMEAASHSVLTHSNRHYTGLRRKKKKITWG